MATRAVTAPVPGLGFNFDWERPEGVVAPELAATWARVEIWVGRDCVTQVQDSPSGASRRSIYCSLYPLAEWVAFNWWFLRAHLRPAALAASPWAGPGPRSNGRPDAWARHHNLRSVGEGFFWPNLSILPEGRLTRLLWHADEAPSPHSPLRYLGQGELRLPSEFVEGALGDLVEAVLTRLREEAVDETVLAAEWRAIRESSREEQAFCEAAARLGLDAYDIDPHTAGLLSETAQTLEAGLVDEFLDAVDPACIESGLRWIEEATLRISRSTDGADGRLLALRAQVGRERVGSQTPWERGYREAWRVRQAMDLQDQELFDLEGLVAIGLAPHEDRGLLGLAGRSDTGSTTLLLGRRARKTVSRFAGARALWHLIFEPDRRHFLISELYGERQSVERAFAAELLAPGAALRERLGGTGVVSSADLEEAADDLGVSPFVVWHQVHNQLDLSIVD
jgi:hypothetical protein